jgi:fumarate reductase flavoprotein subunit
MKELMDEKVGIFRDGPHLEEAVEELKELLQKTKHINVKSKVRAGNPELEEAYRVPRMLKVALCVAKGARDRTESRGAHYREDFLKRDDANWLNRTLTSWPNADDLEPTITYEPLDIMKMEMPPAFRGYGAKGMIIEHELSEKRQQEVDELTEKMQTEGKDRHEIQHALMPFDLPMNYKEKNERAGDK